MKPGTADGGRTSVYAFLKNPTLVDYPGRLAAVFFTSGCNMRCGYCHNPDLLRTRQRGMGLTRLLEACEGFRDHWVEAAVITGGEPTLAPDLARIIAFFKSFGWAVKLDTNGSRPEVLREVIGQVDYVAMDIKTSPDRYTELTGFAHPGRIAESIRLVQELAADYEFRTTLLDPFHDDDQLTRIAELVRGARRYVLQPFVPKDEMPDEAYRGLPRTSPERLREAASLMAECAGEVLLRGE
ncbi:MAG: anaerobic ribonucleoside-triphosphate reductase activating protein [bacterium]